MESDALYAGLDKGIRFPVRVVNAAGIRTNQSCQGGSGHSYPYPSIDIEDSPTVGFAVLHALEQYGIRCRAINRHWRIDAEDGTVADVFWRIELRKAWPERASEVPVFTVGHASTWRPK